MDLFYPSMKNLKSKDKTSSLNDEIKSQTSSDSAKVSDNNDDDDILDLMFPSMRGIQSKFKTGMKTGNKTAFEMKEPETTKDFNEDFTVGKMDYKPKNNKHGIVTGGASSDYDNDDINSKLLVGGINITDTDKSSKTIAGVSKGNEMTLEEAMKGTNPEYSHFGNPTYRKNCQSAVSVFELRKRGYPVEYKVPQTDEERKIQEDLAFYPNKAYLIPNTKQRPSMNKINVKSTDECKKFLNEKVKTNERYIFTHSLQPVL